MTSELLASTSRLSCSAVETAMAIGSQRCERRQIGGVMKYRGRDVLARHGKLLGISEMVKTGALEHKKHRSRGKDGEKLGACVRSRCKEWLHGRQPCC